MGLNPFVIAGTALYICASIWYLYQGGENSWALSGMFGAYAIANLFIAFIK